MRTAATTVRNRDRAPVTRDLIFRRALDIIDTEGLEALTMRRLAADLGVEAASLYHHVPSKQALLDGAVSVMRESMVFGDPLPNDWREIMAMVFLRYLDVLTAHPHMLPLATRRVDSDHVDGLAYLVTLGIAEADAVALWQSLLAFVVGFAGLATSTTRADTGRTGGLSEANANAITFPIRFLLERANAQGRDFSAVTADVGRTKDRGVREGTNDVVDGTP